MMNRLLHHNHIHPEYFECIHSPKFQVRYGRNFLGHSEHISGHYFEGLEIVNDMATGPIHSEIPDTSMTMHHSYPKQARLP